VDTVRKYNLVEKDFKLPPYQHNDTGILMHHFINLVGENYKIYCEAEKNDYYTKSKGSGKFMPKTDFEKTLKPLLAEICRYCIKYWHVHPWLSRSQAHADAVAHLKEKFERKGSPKKLIDAFLSEIKDNYLVDQVLALKTIPKEADPPYKVFDDNETAHFVLANFLKHRKHKCKKDSLDVLEDMHEYLATLIAPGDKAKFAMFKEIVIRETPALLEKKRKAEEKLENAKRKQQEKESKKQQEMQKKREILEARAKKAKEAAEKEKEASTERPGNLRRGGEPEGASDKEQEEESGGGETREEGKTADADEEMTAPEVDLADIYAEYHFSYASFEIVEQATASRASNRSKNTNAAYTAGIKKTIVRLEGHNKVVIQYEKPGPVWTQQIGARIGNVIGAMIAFNAEHADLVEASIEGGTNRIDGSSARVILAIMLHNTANSDKELDELGVHANYWEPNFIKDLNNMKNFWLPHLLETSILHLQGLYHLVCQDLLCDKTAEERTDLFKDVISNKDTFGVEKGKQVMQIIKILKEIDLEIVHGKEGEKKGATDPFDTKSQVTDDF
jgi:outer membrane biosynthesis protein TonB